MWHLCFTLALLGQLCLGSQDVRPTRLGPEEVGKACTLACVDACMAKLKEKSICDNFCTFSLHIANEHFDEIKRADPTMNQIV